jgi:hypothetical protein
MEERTYNVEDSKVHSEKMKSLQETWGTQEENMTYMELKSQKKKRGKGGAEQ